MRESEVRGKLARFLAGMRAYERQRAEGFDGSGGGGGGAAQPLPPVLSEFIAWAGDLLAGEASGSAAAGNGGSTIDTQLKR